MTSEFDNLMSIFSRAEKNPTYEPIAMWLADICVKQADSKESGWNFKTWKEKQGDLLDYYGKWAKFYYLDSCHSKLDHGKYHGKVFTIPTWHLIKICYAAVRGEREIYGVKECKKHFPELLSNLGYAEKNGVWIKND